MEGTVNKECTVRVLPARIDGFLQRLKIIINSYGLIVFFGEHFIFTACIL